MKIFFISSIIILSFLNIKTNFELNQKILEEKNQNSDEGRVTGVGGIFFKTKDPSGIKEWYSKNLGLVTDQYGTMFEFRLTDKPEVKGYLQWSPFSENTKYFEPSTKDFMINYRVNNIEKLVEQLRKNGVTVVDEIESYDYGKFVHIMDPDNNKIELWEPVDSVFTKSDDVEKSK